MSATQMLLGGGAGASAVGTIAGALGQINAGKAAVEQSQYQAGQLRANEGQAIGSSQRTMLDTIQQGRLLASKATAAAGASGVNAGVGSPAEDIGNIVARTKYNAAMDLFRGQSAATGMENQARAALWSGQVAQQGAKLSAFGTIAGGAGSLIGTYGRFLPNPNQASTLS